MRKTAILLILFWIVNQSFSQTSNYLYYRLNGCKSPYAVLYSTRGNITKPIDTAYRQQSGGYAFLNIDRYPTGIYTVEFNDSVYTELIFNNEDVVVEADMNNILMTMKVKKSIENLILFDYWQNAIVLKDSIAQMNFRLQKMLSDNYGDENEATEKLWKKIDFYNNQVISYLKKLKEAYPKAFAPKLLSAFQLPDYNDYLIDTNNLPYANEKEFYKHHFFDNIDFSDARLLNSRVIYVAISDYMNNFGNPASTSNYTFIINKVMGIAKANDEVYMYCLNLFIRNFDNTIWEDVFAYSIEKYYLNAYPEGSPETYYYKKKAEAIRKLKPGNAAPNFSIRDTSGNLVELYKIKAKAKMLIFYSSDCPHCEEALPNLINLYSEYKDLGVEFIGIAIDDDVDLWKKELKKYNIQWISLSDLKGMASPIIDSYNIWMTPTMFILDKKNIIVKKPNSEDEIHSTFLQLLY